MAFHETTPGATGREPLSIGPLTVSVSLASMRSVGRDLSAREEAFVCAVASDSSLGQPPHAAGSRVAVT